MKLKKQNSTDHYGRISTVGMWIVTPTADCDSKAVWMCLQNKNLIDLSTGNFGVHTKFELVIE